MSRRWVSFFVVMTLVAVALPATPLSALPNMSARRNLDSPRKARWLKSLQSPTSLTTENADGTYTTQVHGSPVQFKSDGQWVPIDNRLVPNVDGHHAWRTKSNRFTAKFGKTLSGEFLELKRGDQTFGLSLQGEMGVPAKVDGSSALYKRAFPSTDIRYDAIGEGVKETLTLDSANAPSTYHFLLSAPESLEATAEAVGDGSWNILSGEGELLLTLPAPTVFDSGPLGGESGSARLDVQRGEAGFEMTLSVDPQWLDDPSRRFPVFLDPTMQVQYDEHLDNLTTDLRLDYANPTGGADPGSTRLPIGANTTKSWRAAVRFDLRGIPSGVSISTAKLGLFHDGSCLISGSYCTGKSHQLDAHQITSTWNQNSQPGNVGFAQSVYKSVSIADDKDAARWIEWNVTEAVQNWRSGTWVNNGLLLKRSNDAPANPILDGPVFRSHNDTESSLHPRLQVTWGGGASLDKPAIVHANGAELTWWSSYGVEIHRSLNRYFTPTSQTKIATIHGMQAQAYRDQSAAPNQRYTYRVKAADGTISNPVTVLTPPLGQARATLQGSAEEAVQITSSPDPAIMCRNRGASENVKVGVTSSAQGLLKHRGLIRFGLREIPSDAVVTSAELSLFHRPRFTYANDPAPEVGDVEVERMRTRWVEGESELACSGTGATWVEAQEGVPWSGTGGGDAAGANEAIITVPAGDKGGWDRWQVNDIVSQWLSGQAPNHGFRVHLTNETDVRAIDYHSDDYASSPATRPMLTINYSETSPSRGPQGAIISPAPSAVETGNTSTIQATASDDGSVDRVEFFYRPAGGGTETLIDSVEASEAEDGTVYSLPWNVTNVNGPVEVSAIAYDDVGNSSPLDASPSTPSVDALPITLDKAPTVSLSNLAPGEDVSATETVAATASADSEIVRFYVDGKQVGTDDSPPFTDATAAWNTLDESGQTFYDGPHVVTAVATDSSGTETVSTPISVDAVNTSTSLYRASINPATEPPAELVEDPGWAQTSPPPPGTPAVPPGDSVTTGRKLNAPAALTEQVDVVVENDALAAWAPQMQLWYRWFDLEGNLLFQSQSATLPTNFTGPQTIEVDVASPSLPVGTDAIPYELRFDLWNPAAGQWFAASGNAPSTQAVKVERDLSNRMGVEDYHEFDGISVGAGMVALTNVANGNSILRWTPYATPGRGLSSVVNLTYNSLEADKVSPAGNNFSLAISSLTRFGSALSVKGTPNEVTLIDGDGTEHQFTKSGSVWVEPPGVDLYLRQTSQTNCIWEFTRPDRVRFCYNAAGEPESVIDRNGQKLVFELWHKVDDNVTLGPRQYHGNDDPGPAKFQIRKVTDAGGDSISLTYYDASSTSLPHVKGRVKSITGHGGRQFTFHYTNHGNLRRITQVGDPVNGSTHGMRTPSRTWVFSYTKSSNSAVEGNEEDPNQDTAQSSTRLYSVADPRGKKTRFHYLLAPGGSPLHGRLDWREDRTGIRTSYAYNEATSETVVTAPENQEATYGYDGQGKVILIKNRLTPQKVESTSIEWSGDFKVEKVTEPSGAFSAFTWNHNGYPLTITDQRQKTSSFEYENVAVDAFDTAKHISDLRFSRRPKHTTTNPVQWEYKYGNPVVPESQDPNKNPTEIVDPEGNHSFLSWDLSNGNLTSTTDGNGHQTQYLEHDDNGLPTKVIRVFSNSSNNLVTKLGHDDDGNLLFVQDPNHASLTGSPDLNYRTVFRYDPFHRLVRTSTPKSTALEPGNLIWSGVAYDENDNITTSFGPHYGAQFDGSIAAKTTAVYDDMGRVKSTSNPENEKTSYTYDEAGRLETMTLPEGVVTTAADRQDDYELVYTYDNFSRVVAQSAVRQTPGGGSETLKSHNCYEDLTGDLVAVVPPKGSSPTFSCTSPGVYARRAEYYPDHRLKSTTNPTGAKTTLLYDDNGNVLSQTVDDKNAAGAAVQNETSVVYDKLDRAIKVIEPLERGATGRKITTAFEYDGVGNVTRAITPRGWDWAIAANQDPFQTQTPYETTYEFDAADRMKLVKLPQNAYVHRRYDKNGNLTQVSLPLHREYADFEELEDEMRLTYFDTGWIASSDDTSDPVDAVSFDYTAEGQQAERFTIEWEPGGNFKLPNPRNRMSWRYFPDGMLKERTDRNGDRATYKYDRNNNLIEATDTTGVFTRDVLPSQVSTSYDWLNRPIQSGSRQSSAPIPPGGITVGDITSTTYDANGNVSKHVFQVGTQPARTSSFEYNEADQVKRQEVYEGTTSCIDALRVDNVYKPTGFEDLRTVWRGSGSMSGGVCSQWSKKQTTDWEYLPNGKVESLQTSVPVAGTDKVRERHQLSYISNNLYVNGHRTNDEFGLSGYDPTDCEPTLTDSTPCVASYDYDARDRLRKYFDGRSANEFNPRWTKYTFDDTGVVRSGNLIKEQTYHSDPDVGTPTVSSTKTYTYEGNRLQTVAAGGSTSYYRYDDLGNLACITSSSTVDASACTAAEGSVDPAVLVDYTYDGLDRLSSYRKFTGGSAPSAHSLYRYDALDRVVQQVEDHWGTMYDRTQNLGYLGLSGIAISESIDHDDASVSDLTKSYAVDAHGTRLGMTVIGPSSSGRYTYSHDVHGNVSMLTSDSGVVRASYGYTPYGAEDWNLTEGDRQSVSTALNLYRYGGKRLDNASGSYDMGARRYSPADSRFLQNDVLHGASADLSLSMDPLTQNRYALAGGNPVSYVEMDGHAVTPDGGGGKIPDDIKKIDPDQLLYNFDAASDVAREEREYKECGSGCDSTQLVSAIQRLEHAQMGITGPCEGECEVPEWTKAVVEFVVEDAVSCIGGALDGEFRGVDCALAAPWGKAAKGANWFVKGLTKHGDEALDGARGLGRIADGLSGTRTGRTFGSCLTNSFTGRTRVLMANGRTKRISKIKVGDRVLAHDPETGERGPRRVTRVIEGSGRKSLVDIEVDRHTITATDGHPFWDADKAEWVDAEDLVAGDRLFDEDGSSAEVGSAASRVATARVYNLSVRGIRTYFVTIGDVEALVHNCGGAIDDLLQAVRPGRSPNVGVVDSEDDLFDLFDKLSTGGTKVDNAYPGTLVELPDGTTVGLRSKSSSGGWTLDVQSGDRQFKVHVSQ